MKKEKSDKNAVAELTREGLYKENKWLWEENKKLKEDNKRLREGVDAGQKIVEDLISKNKKLKEENEYRESVADILPEGEGHIAEETIQDLQKEIKNLKLIQETNEKQIQNDIKERDELREENKNLNKKIDKLILKIDQLEEENENLRKDLFHLTNNGQRKNPTTTQGAEGVKGEGGEE